MATDFFERQSAARQSTQWLVILFSLGVIGIVGATSAAAYFAVGKLDEADRLMRQPGRQGLPDQFAFAFVAGASSLTLIGAGSLFKTFQLRGGGTPVAESLGARRIYPDSTDRVERRVLNVVEEMALASGVPAPPVFLLPEEQGINAFAAGYAPSDAVVAVTRGCAEQLTRAELQGVIAHEFSHILNGDMRLNIRLIGVLHGILLLGLIGRILFRLAANSRGGSDNKKGGAAALVVVGLALIVLGYLGSLMGSLIKAAVSRQREFLADASAVQFTRNPSGLAGALRRIGSMVVGSRILAPRAAEASHMFFAQGVWEGLTSLTATHPPLAERIRRLDPQWDGVYPPAPATPAAWSELPEATSGLSAGSATGGSATGGSATGGLATGGRGTVGGAVGGARGGAAFGGTPRHEPSLSADQVGAFADDDAPLDVVRAAADQVGEPNELHRSYASELIAALPADVLSAAREPYGARAVVFGLLTDRRPEIREAQLRRLAELASDDIVALTVRLLPSIDGLDDRARLPLVDLTLPALRAMSATQYRTFATCFRELVAADQRLGLFEWALHSILLRHLKPQFEKQAAPRAASMKLGRLANECSILMSTLALADNRRQEAPQAVERARAELPGIDLQLLDASQCGLEPLGRALDRLALVAPQQRRRLVAACAACICADQDVTVAEAELLRGICDMLDCPLPPLLPGQPVGR